MIVWLYLSCKITDDARTVTRRSWSYPCVCCAFLLDGSKVCCRACITHMHMEATNCNSQTTALL
jgi:hypothetical protein